MFQDQKDVELVLSALGEQLEILSDKPVELLVSGGSALNILGLVRRATKDVDILAYIGRSEKGETFLIKADSLTPELVTAAKKVARDFNLPDDWLNTGPAPAVDLGLPDGFMERATTRVFGNRLAILFLGHYDQIHFKLYAAVDQGAGKHLDDLLALKPTSEEIESAARWSMTHDVSETYRQSIKDLLKYMGYEDVADKL